MNHNLSIRWIHKSDIPQIKSINKDILPSYDFDSAIISKAITSVIEQNGVVLGYYIYNHVTGGFRIEYVAVRQEYRRCGFGSRLVCNLIEYSLNSGHNICVKVEGSDLASLLFFKYNGFKAIAIVQENSYEYYIMEWNREDNVLFSSIREDRPR